MKTLKYILPIFILPILLVAKESNYRTVGQLHSQNEVTEPVNLGSGTGVSIKEVADIVSEYFNIDIKWDTTKPMGDMKRLMSTKRAEKHGFKPEVSLEDGIIKTIKWYKEEFKL